MLHRVSGRSVLRMFRAGDNPLTSTLFCILVLFYGIDNAVSGERISTTEAKLLAELNIWVSGGHPDPDSDSSTLYRHIQNGPMKTCSALVMATATQMEREAFINHAEIEEYDFRYLWCAHLTIDKIYPQDSVNNKSEMRDICREGSDVRFIRLICDHYYLN